MCSVNAALILIGADKEKRWE